MKFNIVTAGIGRRLIDADVLATPRLISDGTRQAVEAYRSGEYQGRSVWRVRDDAYDAAGTTYTTVRVEVVS